MKSFIDKKIVAIVPAAGIGNRMKINYPKQYLYIGNNTILEHSVKNLLCNKNINKVIIVLNPKDTYFSMLPLASHHKVIYVKTGGKTRAESVLSGLKLIKKEIYWVLIHDAVRPCLHLEDLSRLILSLKNNKIGSILASPAKDTMKISKTIGYKDNLIIKTIQRKFLWHAFTPQIFSHFLLKKCLLGNLHKGIEITDESLALENYGLYPKIVVGYSNNIKITTYEDLELAKFYLNREILI